jgi:ribonuclease VapC
MLASLPIRVVPVDAALSYEAGMLRPLTLPGGLSLMTDTAWRWPSATAFRLLMAERRWSDIAAAADVRFE